MPASANAPADLLITNARIFTCNTAQPWAEAVAIRGNRIVWVGTREEALAWQAPGVQVVDGQGGTLTPGFIDSHFHLLWGALGTARAQLQHVEDLDDLKSTLFDFAGSNLTARWLTGLGLRYGVLSSRHELDTILQGTALENQPVYVGAYDGHTAWANTRALEIAGILHSGDAPGNGIIVRDAQGLATGELRETAMNMVRDHIPVPDAAHQRELLRRAIRQINASGITSVHNMNGDMEELALYAALEDMGELTLRVYTPFLVGPEMEESDLQEAVEMTRLRGEFARGGAVKFFMDGVWESYTALTLEPYADNPSARPEGIFSAEHFTRMAGACDRLGLQIFVHCCGDGAVRRALDGYAAIQKRNGPRDSRHRIEHIEVIHPADLPRFQQLGVIASMQTSHAPVYDGGDDPSQPIPDVWLERVGKQRWPLSFAWRELKNAGAVLALGSDWNVASYDPLASLNAALNRKRWSPDIADQRLVLEECIWGYTRAAAYAEFQEHHKGRIQAGFLADMVLFSHDLFALAPQDIQSARCILTVVNGEVVFAA